MSRSMKRPNGFFIALLAGTIFLLLAGSAFACGLLTHGEIVERAVWAFDSSGFPSYGQLVSAHRDALQAGSTFPDWGWQFGYRPESGIAHQYAFLEATADYIHQNYLPPWDEETEKLVVFLFGNTSHVVADISWHAQQGFDEGFLAVMGHQDFQGSFDDAHLIGDFGGDVLCSSEFDLSYMEPWYVPVDDLAIIYNDLGFVSVTPETLTWSMGLLFLATRAEKYGVWLLHDLWLRSSPFLEEQFQDYFIGGLDDMGIWTAWTWETIIDYLENGLPPKTGEGPPPTGIWEENMAQWINMGLAMLDAGLIEIETERTDRGVVFRSDVMMKHSSFSKGETLAPDEADRSLQITTDVQYSYLGSGLAVGDFNQDGFDDLAVGAPGYLGKHDRPAPQYPRRIIPPSNLITI